MPSSSPPVQYFYHLHTHTRLGVRQLNTFRYRFALGFFIIALIVSGLTAFPLRAELASITRWLGISDASDFEHLVGLRHWIAFVSYGLEQTYARFPFFGYASDWLAYSHLVIALFFFLPLLDPPRYRGVLYVGLIACLGVFVIAFVCGPVREIPIFWRLIDCSFGLVGAIPLLYCMRVSRDDR
jgi:hypothetical protein